MIIKERKKPKELVILEILMKRKELSQRDYMKYQHLMRGYEGELRFDSYLKRYGKNLMVLNDIQLKYNEKYFQIDTIVITNDIIYLFEIKNYHGQYYFDQDILYKVPNKEIENPTLQRNRTISLFRMFLKSKGIDMPLKSYIVFIHPQCSIYQTPLNQQIIFHSNVHSILTQLNENEYSGKKSKNIVRVLESSLYHAFHQEDIFNYTFDELQKGIPCYQCGSMETYPINRVVKCKCCEAEEIVSISILRCIKNFQKLFPNEKLTSNIISKWCGDSITHTRCKRVLLNHFTKQGNTKSTYFIKKVDTPRSSTSY
ncbi:Nuclease-related domain protein [Paraliobacillus sp. PM-2]|uniref:nuclease-related domain-containing protein n=1 Tax=Paraliobacillus sp. PM-2 TaxID=1462524 RepID=UPI00061C3233|nr:nuclease-related domain-containing protein [Paraliobacillus sp. PM-2]CQR45928.1 Nuclease-related domain protein [Paraliobacillus sp. PM-2]